MLYDHLGQENGAAATTTTTVVRPRLNFFQRLFPSIFPVPTFFPPSPAYGTPCVPVQVPEGTLGRNTNGQLTVNGQTFCSQVNAPYVATGYRTPNPYGSFFY